MKRVEQQKSKRKSFLTRFAHEVGKLGQNSRQAAADQQAVAGLSGSVTSLK